MARKKKVLVLAVRVSEARDPELVKYVQAVVGTGRRKMRGVTSGLLIGGLRMMRAAALAAEARRRGVMACTCPAREFENHGCRCGAAEAERRTKAACSCPADERAKTGCRCQGVA